MAAKQGLSAQLSQASEDAKRAVLQRTSLTSSLWFSNLNTTCTIKSAPPRSPEVLSLLSTKSGWLFKRNEQHVWQSRWCCVVPHTFLYYFDANVLPGQAQPPVPTSAQQEDWNHAIKEGYGGRSKHHAPRSTLFFSTNYNSNHNSNTDDPASGGRLDSHSNLPPPSGVTSTDKNGESSFTSLQPAGIIDLECYTSVHRSSQNQLVMELSGDDTVNPDLRSFYFCANSEDDTEDWTQAFLGQRHSALMDETDAYKQVCDGFAQQLQVLHQEMDMALKRQEDAQEELYQVRSQMEELRRNSWRLVEEALERNSSNSKSNSTTVTSARAAYQADLNTVKSQDMGLLAAVQLLSDYTRVLEESCADLAQQNDKLQGQLRKSNHSDHEKAQNLEKELEELKESVEEERAQWQKDMEVAQQRTEAKQKELQDVQKELASTRMEVTMYQSSTRNKLSELQNHKKILKKEVIDLRQKLEDAHSEINLIQHKHSTNKMEMDQERKKMELLERYVEKMESQVKVQQNMMEMMSASGVGSVHGGSVIHYDNYDNQNQFSPPRRNIVLVNTPSSVQADEEDADEPIRPRTIGIRSPNRGGVQNGVVGGTIHSKETDELANLPQLLRRAALDNDVDNKSHMSELTEDRTQKQFDAAFYRDHGRDYPESNQTPTGNSRPLMRLVSPRGSIGVGSQGNNNGPPSYIIGVGGDGAPNHQQLMQQYNSSMNGDNPKVLDTISSSNLAKNRQHQSAYMNITPSNRSLAGSLRDIPRSDKSIREKPGDSTSIGSGSTAQRLSVAQRARLEADRGSTPVRIRVDSSKLPGSNLPALNPRTPSSPPSAGRQRLTPSGGASVSSRGSRGEGSGFFSSFGRRIEQALDNSVFGVGDTDDSSSSLDKSQRSLQNADEKESSSNDETPSSPKQTDEKITRSSPATSGGGSSSYLREGSGLQEEKKSQERSDGRSPLTLAERQQLQREKQLKFLKDNGIIKDESDVRGGAGAASPTFDGASVSSGHFPGSPSVSYQTSPSPKQRIR